MQTASPANKYITPLIQLRGVLFQDLDADSSCLNSNRGLMERRSRTTFLPFKPADERGTEMDAVGEGVVTSIRKEADEARR